MLSKLQSDYDYFLGYGNRNLNILCNKSFKSHINRMKDLWITFPDSQKRVWLTWEQLLQYEKKLSM